MQAFSRIFLQKSGFAVQLSIVHRMLRDPLRQFYSRYERRVRNLFVRRIETEVYPMRHTIVIRRVYGRIFIMKLESKIVHYIVYLYISYTYI